MSNEILLAAAVALAFGLAGGYALARLRRRRPPAPPPLSARTSLPIGDPYDDETKPTLVPFREHREAGRNLAKLKTDPDSR